MYTVKKKELTPNIVWDAEKGEQLCHFKKGVFETEDVDVAVKLQEMGYEVSPNPAESNDTAETSGRIDNLVEVETVDSTEDEAAEAKKATKRTAKK